MDFSMYSFFGGTEINVKSLKLTLWPSLCLAHEFYKMQLHIEVIYIFKKIIFK